MPRELLLRVVVLLVSLLFLDQASKVWSEENLVVYSDPLDTEVYQGSRQAVLHIGPGSGDEDVAIGSTFVRFQLNYVRNHGAAWGFLSNVSDAARPLLFHGISFVTGLIFVLFALQSRWSLPFIMRLGLLTIVAGASGNVFDRVYRGYVVDLFDLRWSIAGWRYALPAFNVADVMVVCGLVFIVIGTVRGQGESI